MVPARRGGRGSGRAPHLPGQRPGGREAGEGGRRKREVEARREASDGDDGDGDGSGCCCGGESNDGGESDDEREGAPRSQARVLLPALLPSCTFSFFCFCDAAAWKDQGTAARGRPLARRGARRRPVALRQRPVPRRQLGRREEPQQGLFSSPAAAAAGPPPADSFRREEAGRVRKVVCRLPPRVPRLGLSRRVRGQSRLHDWR